MVKKSSFTQINKKKKKSNPVGWIIFFVIMILVLIFKAVPAYRDWIEKKEIYAFNSAEAVKLEKTQIELIEQRDALVDEFERVADPYLRREAQIFPEGMLDIKKISKILELYSLQISLAENFGFELTELGFGATGKSLDGAYQKTSVSVGFNANEKILRDFVDFLQTGRYPERFEIAKNSGQLDIRAYNFLKENIMPLAHIESIDIKERNVDEIPGKIAVSVQFYLFSRPATETTKLIK